MACCAFALFVLSQLFWFFARVWAALPGRKIGETVRVDRAGSWRVTSSDTSAGPAAVAGAGKSPWPRRLAVLFVAESLLLGSVAVAGTIGSGSVAASTAPMAVADAQGREAGPVEEPSLAARLDAMHAPICRSLGLR